MRVGEYCRRAPWLPLYYHDANIITFSFISKFFLEKVLTGTVPVSNRVNNISSLFSGKHTHEENGTAALITDIVGKRVVRIENVFGLWLF